MMARARWVSLTLLASGVVAAENLCDSGRVVVVGAGVSGLACAATLVANGCEVVVVEANDYVGGRTKTHEDEGSAVDGLDLGAHWIEGNAPSNPLKRMILDLGLPYTTLLSNREASTERFALYDEVLGRLDDAQVDALAKLWVSVLDRLEALASDRRARGERDASLADGFDAVLGTMELGAVERRQLDWCMAKIVTADDAGNRSRESLYSFALDDSNDFTYYNGSAGGGDDVLLEGYQSLPKAMARGLDVRLGAPVSAVRYGDRGGKGKGGAVVVALANGTEFRAAAVVVTVPAGVLKAGVIAFEPPLAAPLRDALAVIEMGWEDHVYLTYESPPWRPRDYNIGFASAKSPGLLVDIYNLEVETLARGLNMFQVGAPDVAWSNRSDADVRSASEAVVEAMFGASNATKSNGFLRSNWRDVDTARGSYSFSAVGCTLDDRKRLGRALDLTGTLAFAGEHTCALSYGTVHGAFISGVRAAHHVLGDAVGAWPLVPDVFDLCDVTRPEPEAHYGIENSFPGPGRNALRKASRAHLRKAARRRAAAP